MAMRPLMPGIAAGIGAGLAPLYRRKQFNPLGAAAGGVGAQSTLMQSPPESMLQTGAESQLERMRRGHFARPTGQMPSFGSRPNFGSFGMGQPATPQPDGTRLGDSYAAAMTPGYGRPRLPQTSPDLYGLAPDAPDLGPKDQYGFRRALGTGNIAPYRTAAPGVLGMNGPMPSDQTIGTLPEGAMVSDIGGQRIVSGPNVSPGQLSTLAGRRAAMKESNARWFASDAGKSQLARIGAEAQAKRGVPSGSIGQGAVAKPQPSAIPSPEDAAKAIATTDTKPWSVYGVDYQNATPDQFVNAMRGDTWTAATPEQKAARIAEIRQRMADPRFAGSPYAPELMALMNGQVEGADMESTLRRRGFGGADAEKRRMKTMRDRKEMDTILRNGGTPLIFPAM